LSSFSGHRRNHRRGTHTHTLAPSSAIFPKLPATTARNNDHCSGITSHSSFPIYSTHLTKSLILCYFSQIDESFFVGIEVEQSLIIDDPDGSFTVTAFDANHCPDIQFHPFSLSNLSAI
ncbi:hypothetical protein SOVF_188760, partial [Spinacia oleracea]